MSKGFDIDSVDIEMSREDMKRLVKKYKKLKKYQNSNFHAISKLNGDETIIDKLTKESEDFKL
jgi:predicted transcriptional regulator